MNCTLTTEFPRVLVSIFCLSAIMLIAGCGNSMTTAPTGIVVCERVEMFPSGHVSCIRIHNGYRFPSFPNRATFCTFAQLPGTKDGLRYQYKIKDSDGTDISHNGSWSEGPPNQAFPHNVAAEFKDVEFKHAGQYDVVLEVNSQPVGKTTMVIEQGAAPGQNAASPTPNASK